MDGGSPGFSIGEASRLVGVSPEALRSWERQGLIEVARSRGGTRYYREGDLERLRRIRDLRSVHGLNFAAIRRELGPATPPSDGGPSKEQSLGKVGERLRRLRIRNRKTLREVSAATGLSTSFLSSLERGHTGASIATLRALVAHYGVNWREIFGVEVEHRVPVVRPDERPTTRWPNGVRFEDLATGGSLMDPAVVYVPPETGSGGPFSHRGEELIYVLSGTLFVELQGEERGTHRLTSGDAMYFSSSTPHRWWTQEEQAQVVYVNSPPSF